MDRAWMYNRLKTNRRGLNAEFENGVEEFLSKARKLDPYVTCMLIRCPCDKCKCMRLLKESEVRYHLYKDGFQPMYWIWTEHGEEEPESSNLGESSSGVNWDEENQFEMMNNMVNDVFRPILDGETRGFNQTVNQDEMPNAECQRFYDMLKEANKPIYDGCSESTLSIAVKLLAAKSNWHVPQRCVDYFFQMLANVSPTKDNIPKNCYEATRLASKLGMKVQTIDCCENGCMLFYKDDIDLNSCKFCGAARFVPRNPGMGNHKNIPVKRMFYFPVTPRLQRLYASSKTASHMRWHQENRGVDGVLRHPSDGEAWKHFNGCYPEFANEPRNVRLGLCADGFTPYIQASAHPYSCWPVILMPYNLPPEMCMTKPYMFLTCLIPGPRNPTIKIDVFLQPLIDELQQLWFEGAWTYDISTKQNFLLRACLMWTINDFPAYGMLSGWSTHGRLACPYCLHETKSFWLDFGRKHTWFDCHRRFLPSDHPFRRSKRSFYRNRVEEDALPIMLGSSLVREFVQDFPKVTESGPTKQPGFGTLHNYNKRSIFWDLPY